MWYRDICSVFGKPSAELTRATRHQGHVPALVSEMRGDLERTIGNCVNSVDVRSHASCLGLIRALPSLESLRFVNKGDMYGIHMPF